MTTRLTTCDFCGGHGAEIATPPDFDGVRIRCRRCGAYDIVEAVMEDLAGVEPDRKLEVLKKAKQLAGPDRVPVINSVSMS